MSGNRARNASPQSDKIFHVEFILQNFKSRSSHTSPFQRCPVKAPAHLFAAKGCPEQQKAHSGLLRARKGMLRAGPRAEIGHMAGTGMPQRPNLRGFHAGFTVQSVGAIRESARPKMWPSPPVTPGPLFSSRLFPQPCHSSPAGGAVLPLGWPAGGVTADHA